MRKKHFTKPLGLIISEEVYDRIIEETDREEKSVSSWIREAIEKKLWVFSLSSG
jgi:predicted CopG family antitoxin